MITFFSFLFFSIRSLSPWRVIRWRILLTPSVISGGGGGSCSLWAMEVFVSPSSGCPRASLAPPQHKGRDSIMKWHLGACSKSTLLQKRSLKMYPCPLSPSVCLPVSLSFPFLKFLLCSSGRHKTDICIWSHTHVWRSKVRVHWVWVTTFPLVYTVLLIWSN